MPVIPVETQTGSPHAGARFAGRTPLDAILRAHAGYLPLVIGLGIAATLFEGLGVGILIPLLSLLLGEGLPAATPAPVRAVADIAAAWSPASRVAVLCGIIAALFMAKALIQTSNLVLQARLLERLSHTIRTALADKLLAIPYASLIGQDSARYLDVLHQDLWNFSAWLRSLLSLAASLAAVALIGVLLVWLDWRLTAILFVVGLAALPILPLFERALRKTGARAKQASVALDARFEAVLFSQRTIRLFRQERAEGERHEIASDRLRKAVQRRAIFRALAVSSLETMFMVLSVAVVLAGYWLGLSLASIAAYVVLLSRVQPHLRSLSEARLSKAEASASTEEINWLLALDAEADGPRNLPGAAPPPDFAAPIVFEDVAYTYPNKGAGLTRASFTIEPGVATALVGPSGSGKSTVINILTRLLEPDRGRVTLGGRPIEAFPLDAWRRAIAIAGQDVELIEGTVAENIAYGRPHASRAEIEEVAEIADVATFAHMLPQGYETRVGRGGTNLSGGQRQRIGLARALIVRPELLVLDEATSAVDGLSEKAIMDLLSAHTHFRTALVISHRESTRSFCRHTVLIRDGATHEPD